MEDGYGTDLRYIVIDGEPWFVAADVCRCLSLPVDGRGTAVHLRKLDEDERRLVRKRDHVFNIGSLFRGCDSSLTLIAESGLYKLAMRSKGILFIGHALFAAYNYRRFKLLH